MLEAQISEKKGNLSGEEKLLAIFLVLSSVTNFGTRLSRVQRSSEFFVAVMR